MPLLTIRCRALLGVALLAAAPACAQSPLPTAEQVVARYVRALGGREAIEAQRFRHTVAEMTMPPVPAATRVETHQAREGNRFRLRMVFPGEIGVAAKGYDGRTGWDVGGPGSLRALEGDELAEEIQQLAFDRALYLVSGARRMVTEGRGTVGGRPCVNVRFTVGANAEIHCYAESDGLLLRVTHQIQADGYVRESTITLSDYQEFGGVRMPTLTVYSSNGEEMHVRTKSVSTEPFDASVFAAPGG